MIRQNRFELAARMAYYRILYNEAVVRGLRDKAALMEEGRARRLFLQWANAIEYGRINL